MTLAVTFLAEGRLWWLLVVAALALLHVIAQLRRRRYEVRFTNVALLDVVAPKRPGWRRHVPVALLLLAIGALVLAVARPAREVQVPRERATVVLAIDTSFSMEATDVAPSRLEAAQDAATRFAEQLPPTINLGLVTFDGIARVRVTPTTEREPVVQAIEALELGPATAIGEAIFASLDAIETVPEPADGDPVPAAIVVMSDGKTTAGRPNEQGAQAALEAGVPVSTIAFGTPFGEIIDPEQLLPIPVPVEPEPLQAIAQTTRGRFFEADSLGELEGVYADIGSAIGYETEEREITVTFVAIALGLAVAAAAMSLVWFNRLV